MELWELTAREQIRELLAVYAHGVDRGRFDEVADLFGSDGVLDVGEAQRVCGRDAIETFLHGVDAPDPDRARDPDRAHGARLAYIRHHVSNVVIELQGRDAARVESYFLVVTEHGPDHWGRYRDDVAYDGERWRFARRVARTDGAAPGSWAEQRIARG